MTLLVAYGSKRGSTKEVAEALAERLREDGRDVDVRRAAEVDDLAPYAGVVLGGSFYFGRWHEDAVRFLKSYRGELCRLPVWAFGLGPKTSEPDEISAARPQLDKALGKVPEVTPRSVAVFGGVIDPSKLHFPLNKLPASDARDWDAVRDWADEIAAA
jgi:menaquinone-dependent protoporphyrinogen oxidase